MKTFLVDDFNDFWYITYSRIFHRVCQKRVFKFEFRLLTLTVQVTLKSHIWSVRIKTLFLDKSSIFDYCLYVFDFCFQIHLHFSIQVEINLINYQLNIFWIHLSKVVERSNWLEHIVSKRTALLNLCLGTYLLDRGKYSSPEGIKL